MAHASLQKTVSMVIIQTVPAIVRMIALMENAMKKAHVCVPMTVPVSPAKYATQRGLFAVPPIVQMAAIRKAYAFVKITAAMDAMSMESAARMHV